MIKAGKLRNKFVTKQGHRCKSCGRYFVERDGFEGMTYPKEIVKAVLHLFIEGVSFSCIRELMHQQHGYWIYNGDILNWARKYGDTARESYDYRTPRPKVKCRDRSVAWLHLGKIREYMYQEYGYRVKYGSNLYWASNYGNSLGGFETRRVQSR